MRVLVTGGCGFIGSNFIKYFLTTPGVGERKVLNLDKQTYAGQGKNIEHMGVDKNPAYRFVRGDICDAALVEKVFSEFNPEIVFNFAAESHVDRSIASSEDFVLSNVCGAVNLFDAATRHRARRFVHVSTDEVYGSTREGSFSEDARLEPSSPYAASKASADLIALAYFKTHKLPLIITRSANNYGEYQFPEKILPLFITNLIEGKKVPLMWSAENPGLNVRDWLHVEDNCRAIWFVAQLGNLGEVYNIPGENERTNINVTRMLLSVFGFGEDMIQRVEHRKAHDFRYSIKGDRLKALGFQYKHRDFESELELLEKWYKENGEWWRPLKK